MHKQFKILMFIIGLITCSCQNNQENQGQTGPELFKRYCVNCHGINGSLMTNGAKDLRLSLLTLEERAMVVAQGRNAMTSFKNTLTENQIEKIVKYTMQFSDSTIHAR